MNGVRGKGRRATGRRRELAVERLGERLRLRARGGSGPVERHGCILTGSTRSVGRGAGRTSTQGTEAIYHRAARTAREADPGLRPSPSHPIPQRDVTPYQARPPRRPPTIAPGAGTLNDSTATNVAPTTETQKPSESSERLCAGPVGSTVEVSRTPTRNRRKTAAKIWGGERAGRSQRPAGPSRGWQGRTRPTAAALRPRRTLRVILLVRHLR